MLNRLLKAASAGVAGLTGPVEPPKHPDIGRDFTIGGLHVVITSLIAEGAALGRVFRPRCLYLLNG